jgi:hypothetical protein
MYIPNLINKIVKVILVCCDEIQIEERDQVMPSLEVGVVVMVVLL